MTITNRVEAGRRERRVLARVSRAAWRLAQAERKRTWGLASAQAEEVSIRVLATALGLLPPRAPRARRRWYRWTENRLGVCVRCLVGS